MEVSYSKQKTEIQKTVITYLFTIVPCEQFLQQIEISRVFLPPVSHGEKCGKFQFLVEIAHKADILILLSL